MTGLTLAILAGFAVLLGENLLSALMRRRAIRRYIRWWADRAMSELNELCEQYEPAFEAWSTLVKQVESGEKVEIHDPALAVIRPTVPPVGEALLDSAQHIPDDVIQALAVVETLLMDLGADARDLLRVTDDIAATGRLDPETGLPICRRLANFYRRTVLMADGARTALREATAHPMFRTK